MPYEGSYDAMNPTIFDFNKTTEQVINISQLPDLEGEFRDAKWIKYTGGKKILVLARNNNRLIFLKPNL